MSTLAAVIALMAIAGALASWIAGAVFAVQGLRAAGAPGGWLPVILWPFGKQRLRSAGPAEVERVNKAFVAFFAFILVAAAAGSVATNLHRLTR